MNWKREREKKIDRKERGREAEAETSKKVPIKTINSGKGKPFVFCVIFF